MTVPVRLKKTAIVGILVLSAAGLSACGGDKRNCVPNASGPASIERVASVDTSAAFVPLRGGGGGGGGSRGGGGSSSSSKGGSSSSSKGGSSSSSKGGSTSSGSSSTKKHTSGSTGFWFFGGGGSKSCPAGQTLR